MEHISRKYKSEFSLLLVRHALALDKTEALEMGIKDFDRWLLNKGIAVTKKRIKRWLKSQSRLGEVNIFSSPSRRCVQTAQILSQKLEAHLLKKGLVSEDGREISSDDGNEDGGYKIILENGLEAHQGYQASQAVLLKIIEDTFQPILDRNLERTDMQRTQRRTKSKRKVLIVVGHEPFLSQFVQQLFVRQGQIDRFENPTESSFQIDRVFIDWPKSAMMEFKYSSRDRSLKLKSFF